MSDRRPSAPPPGWIPPVEDPEIVAARARAQQLAAQFNVVEAPHAGYRHQLAALGIDLLPFAVACLQYREWAGPLLFVQLACVTRLLPLILFGRTLGSALVGFRVLGPRGVRLSPPRALLRELLLPLSVIWSATIIGGLAEFYQWRPDVVRASVGRELDPRLLPDLLADTWSVLTPRA